MWNVDTCWGEWKRIVWTFVEECSLSWAGRVCIWKYLETYFQKQIFGKHTANRRGCGKKIFGKLCHVDHFNWTKLLKLMVPFHDNLCWVQLRAKIRFNRGGTFDPISTSTSTVVQLMVNLKARGAWALDPLATFLHPATFFMSPNIIILIVCEDWFLNRTTLVSESKHITVVCEDWFKSPTRLVFWI